MQNAHNEACCLISYRDNAGIWTIGYDHQGIDVGPGMFITQEEADALRVSDLAEQAGA